MTREDTVQEDTIQWDTIWKGNMMRGYNTKGYNKIRMFDREIEGCLERDINIVSKEVKI